MTSWSLLLAKMCSRWPMSRWAWPTCCWERTWGSTTSDTREYISSSDWMMHFIRLIENHNPASFTLHIRVRVVLLMTDIMSCTTFVRTTKHISRHGQTFRFFPKESRQAKFLEGCFCCAESARPPIGGWKPWTCDAARDATSQNSVALGDRNSLFWLVRALAPAHDVHIQAANQRPSWLRTAETSFQKFSLACSFSNFSKIWQREQLGFVVWEGIVFFLDAH